MVDLLGGYHIYPYNVLFPTFADGVPVWLSMTFQNPWTSSLVLGSDTIWAHRKQHLTRHHSYMTHLFYDTRRRDARHATHHPLIMRLSDSSCDFNVLKDTSDTLHLQGQCRSAIQPPLDLFSSRKGSCRLVETLNYSVESCYLPLNKSTGAISATELNKNPPAAIWTTPPPLRGFFHTTPTLGTVSCTEKTQWIWWNTAENLKILRLLQQLSFKRTLGDKCYSVPFNTRSCFPLITFLFFPTTHWAGNPQDDQSVAAALPPSLKHLWQEKMDTHMFTHRKSVKLW